MSEFHSNSLQLTSYYLYLLQDKIPRLENTEFLSRHMPAALSISKSAVCLFAKSIFFEMHALIKTEIQSEENLSYMYTYDYLTF